MHFIQSRNAIVYIIFLELFEINILGYHMHNYTHKFTHRGGGEKKRFWEQREKKRKDRKWTITKEIEKLHRINLRKNDYENGVGGGKWFRGKI